METTSQCRAVPLACINEGLDSDCRGKMLGEKKHKQTFKPGLRISVSSSQKAGSHTQPGKAVARPEAAKDNGNPAAMKTRRQGVAPQTARPAPSNSATTIASKAGAASERSSRNTPQAKAQVNSAGRGQTMTGIVAGGAAQPLPGVGVSKRAASREGERWTGCAVGTRATR